jgi:hypothetical protein
MLGALLSGGSALATPWLWALIALAVLFVGGWLLVRGRRQTHEKRARDRGVRLALETHPETILVCLRALHADGPRVVACVADALRKAASPLRLRFVIVQEQTPEDVFALLQRKLRHTDFDDLDISSKVRTANVFRSSYLHAFGTYVQMYDGETYVACSDAWNQWEPGWDVALTKVMAAQPAAAVVSAPDAQQFCVYRHAPAHQRHWPAVHGRKFVFEPDRSTAAVAVHVNFMAFHGAHFAWLPAPAQQVPLYVAGTVLSDWLYSRCGCELRTLPVTLFRRPLHVGDGHLQDQRPAQWARTLHLSGMYAQFAGLAKKGVNAWSAGARAQLGLTPAAERTNEGIVKYGSRREMQQQFDIFRAILTM